jgi:hypothetical protein
MLLYIKSRIELPLILSAGKSRVIKWWVDASYATRKKLKSQTGATMSLGCGSVYNMARKQKLNTTSSLEAKSVAADDIMPQMLWTRQFLLAQGVEISFCCYLWPRILFRKNLML